MPPFGSAWAGTLIHRRSDTPSDDGPEFVATASGEWITAVGAETATIEPCGTWENGTVERFGSKLRDEPL